MFENYTSLDGLSDLPRPFDPMDTKNIAQTYTDSIGSFGAFKPLTTRVAELLNFYRSNDKEDTSYLGG